jgi:hypothetical protein
MVRQRNLIFTARTDEITKMKSIGDDGVDDIKSDVVYVKEKEKQAQIIGNYHYCHSMSHDICIQLNCIQRKVLSRYLR